MAASADIAFRTGLELILGVEVPAQVTVSWVSENFHISQTSVQHAIRSGKLVPVSVGTGRGRTPAYLVRPEDALLIWGHRIVSREP